MQPLVFVLPLAAAALASPQGLTAHPQETLQGHLFDIAAFGCLSPFNTEARTQILVRADELPAPAALVGIELNPYSNGLTYGLLQIDASPTTATALSLNFAANVTGPTTTVLQATNVTVPWTTTAWVGIAFTQPYIHDGASSLVLDIRKIVNPVPPPLVPHGMARTSLPPRTDRPQMVFAVGGPGSGMAMAATASGSNDPVSFRLQWIPGAVPTMRHRSDIGPGMNQYGIGGSVDITVQGTPSSLYLTQIATGFLPVPIAVPGIVGLLRVNGVTLALGFLDGAGQALHMVNIPNNPGLVGLYVAYQGGTLDAVTSVPMLTNGMDHFVNL